MSFCTRILLSAWAETDMAIQAYFLDIEALQAPLSVRDVRIVEALNKPYELTITVASAADLNLMQGLDRDAIFSVCPVDQTARTAGLNLAEAIRKPERLYHGIVRSCKRTGRTIDENIYEICIGPRIARLADYIDTRLLQELTVPAAIEKIFGTTWA